VPSESQSDEPEVPVHHLSAPNSISPAAETLREDSPGAVCIDAGLCMHMQCNEVVRPQFHLFLRQQTAAKKLRKGSI
jgi:hypothetical protein